MFNALVLGRASFSSFSLKFVPLHKRTQILMQASAGELYVFHQAKKKKEYIPIYLSSINTIIGQMPNSLHLPCNLLYKLVVLVERNVPLRESDRAKEGRGNSGTTCEEAAEKIN